MGVEGVKNRHLKRICPLCFTITVYVSTRIKSFNLRSISSLQEQNIRTDQDFQTDTCTEGCSADYFYGIRGELRTH